MSARADKLAKQFEDKAQELTDTLEKLSDADWKKVTATGWPIGVTAHHVAGAHEPIAGLVRGIATGQTLPSITMAMIDEGNAKHAKEFAGCTKQETLALHKKGVAMAAGTVRALSDAELDKSGAVLTGMPAMTVQQMVEGIMINHVNDHLGAIRTTLGH